MKYIKAIMRSPTAAVVLLVGLLTLIGVVVKSISDIYVANLPINSTKTAEAKLTELALFTLLIPTPTFTTTPPPTSIPLETEIPDPTFTTTPLPTNIPMETEIPAPTKTLVSTSTITINTAVSEPIETTISTESSPIIFSDDFIDNRNGWLVQNEPGIKSSILGGKYKHTINCPSDPTTDFYYCGYYIAVPNLFAKNFRIELDTMIKRVSPGSVELIAFQFRRKGGNSYMVFFKSTGEYFMNIIFQGVEYKLLEYQPTLNLNDLGSRNQFGVNVKDTSFIPLVNGRELELIEDGNINEEGSLFIILYVSRGGSADIELDNLLLTETK